MWFDSLGICGLCVETQTVSYHGDLETVDSQHFDSESFPSQHGTLTKYWPNVGHRRRRWSNIKTTFGQFLVGVVSCNQFSR